jgi:cell division protease FtsH
MSDLGPVQFEQQEGSVFLGRDYNKSRNFSSQVAFEIDQEQRKIIHECYEKAKKIISENMDLLKLIAEALLQKETITKEEIDYLVENKCLPDEDGEIDMSDFEELSYSDMTLAELRELAKEKEIKNYSKMTKEELIKELEEN